MKNDIEKSTYSALFYFYGFENDTLITGQDLGPILFDVRGVNCNILKYYDDDDSVHTQDHVKGVVWFTNTETNFGFEINLRFFDKSITYFVVLSRCVEGKVNLSFSLNIFNVAHNASLTYFFEDINMNGRKIKVMEVQLMLKMLQIKIMLTQKMLSRISLLLIKLINHM